MLGDEVADLCGAMGDVTRLAILRRLAEGEKSVTELWQGVGVPQPSMSHHLSILRMFGLVSKRRSGRNIFYSLGEATARTADGSIAITRGDHRVHVSCKPQ